MTAYLDYNATAPVRAQVAQAVSEALALGGNASSVHSRGRDARRVVEEAREKVAALLGARPAEVIFTGSGTEANNLALRGVSADHVAVSAVEHDSVLQAAPTAKRLGVDADGRLNLGELESFLSKTDGTAHVSVMAANNETGVLQPIAEVAALVREHYALLHVDAVQAAGKIDISRNAIDADLVTVSAHKLGGPQGVGALIIRDGMDLKPLVKGGGQERSRRAGTENVAGIAGFGVAAELALNELDQTDRITALRDTLETEIKRIAPDARMLGAGAPRLVNTACLIMPDVSAESQIMSLDLAGVMVSAGSACSSGKVTTSHVLSAMGLSLEEANTAIRVSLGWASTEADVDAFLNVWGDLYQRTRKQELEASAA